MEQLGSNWVDFHEILYLRIFWKLVKKIQGSLKTDKNSGHFTQRSMYIYDNISLNCFRMKNISHKICWKNQNTHFMFNTFFSESRAIYEIM